MPASYVKRNAASLMQEKQKASTVFKAINRARQQNSILSLTITLRQLPPQRRDP